MTTRKAFVAGATGRIGGCCLQNLIEDANYSEIIALVRKTSPYHSSEAQGG